MPVNVPSDVVKWITAASVGSGLPYNVVACQVNEESGFNAGAVSPAGAEGPYQFLPSTFYSVWHGSPFSWADSTVAYGIYMSQLLHQFNGNVRDALAAYNAGPGNIGAGMGYADTILSCAGGGIITMPNPATLGQGFAAPGAPNAQPDDWSYYITRTYQHLEELSQTAYYWAYYIGRL